MTETSFHDPALLDELDATDLNLRRVYEELARDPDLASARAGDIAALTERRLDLARQVGLAALAARRRANEVAHEDDSAKAVADVAPDVPTAPTTQVGLPPASAGDVAAWTERVKEKGLGTGNEPPSTPAAHIAGPAWESVLADLMGELGPPRGDDEIWEEVEALDLISAGERIELWPRLPRELSQLWLSMLVARTRAHRERPGMGVDLQARIKAVISRYPVWAKEHTPGHVNGLQLRHAPSGPSWAEDARALWRELEARLADVVEDLPRPTPAKTNKKPKAERPAADPEEHEEAFAPGSPIAQATRGRRTLIVGGDPREPNRARLERAFAFASLEWPDMAGPRAVSAIPARIRGGSYELLIVLQPFVDHSQSEAVIAAAKDSGIRWVLAQGYGIPAVKLGLERFLAGRADGAHA